MSKLTEQSKISAKQDFSDMSKETKEELMRISDIVMTKETSAKLIRNCMRTVLTINEKLTDDEIRTACAMVTATVCDSIYDLIQLGFLKDTGKKVTDAR